MDEKFTAWCGLCCANCIPSNTKLFFIVHDLEKILSDLQFDEYARLKSEKNPIFTEYPAFIKVLREIGSLQCPVPCRSGGGKTNCEIRKCAQLKGHYGCWECTNRGSCTKLDLLRRVHPNLDYHLNLIGQYGPKHWFSKRRAHYRWQKERSEKEDR